MRPGDVGGLSVVVVDIAAAVGGSTDADEADDSAAVTAVEGGG